MTAIFLKEIKDYFSSSLAWSLIAAYLFIVGFLFAFSIEEFSNLSISAMQGNQNVSAMESLVPPLMATFGFLLLFFLPLLTMRLFAEEKRSGTLDLLYTYPITDAQIIAGKFLAAMCVVAVMLVLTSCGLIVLQKFTPLEWKVIATGYLGLLLLASCFVAFGMWASSWTSSQIIASSVTYSGLLILWIISGLDNSGMFKDIFGDLSALSHLENMVKGVFNTHDIVYYVCLTGLFLFLTARVMESRKWRG